MVDRTTKLRWRRRIRKSKRQVEGIGVQAEEQFERHFVKRLGRLWLVKRFIVSWTALLVLLIVLVIGQVRALSPYYQQLAPEAGGTYVEGILGSFTNANPIYATSVVDRTVSRLLFASLFSYDEQNQLIGDLAEGYDVNERGTLYTVRLRQNLLWHDGRKLTAEDVVFTYSTIQNPDAKSPLASSWAGITVRAIDESTVAFELPNSLSAFPTSLTNGIVPKHILDGRPKSELRSVSFNTIGPVGSGPFRWETIEVSGTTPDEREQRIALLPFDWYHHGAPNLDRFIVRSFTDEQRLIKSFQDRELNGAAGLERTPETLTSIPTLRSYNFPLTSSVMAFFKSSNEILSDGTVRKALVMSAEPTEVIQKLGFPAPATKGPLLKFHTGYDPALVQFPPNPDEAAALLESAGWTAGKDGIREKDGKPLVLHLYSKNSVEYTQVAQTLKQQWRKVGVDLELILQSDIDLQTTISGHSYDILLYGISLGVDPDVFAFWHSSQADVRSTNRLNLSEYRSATADTALEAGRTRVDATLRAVKYRPFLESWRNDAPALALYQPRFLYLTRGEAYNLKARTLNAGVERFNNVHEWMIRESKQPKQEAIL